MNRIPRNVVLLSLLQTQDVKFTAISFEIPLNQEWLKCPRARLYGLV